jgi:hypothetical protein
MATSGDKPNDFADTVKEQAKEFAEVLEKWSEREPEKAIGKAVGIGLVLAGIPWLAPFSLAAVQRRRADAQMDPRPV